MALTTPEMKLSVTYEPSGECLEEGCGWEISSSHISNTKVKDHVRATGHEVRVLVETVKIWGPKNR